MSAASERDVVRIELRWALAMLGVVGLIFAAILFAALDMGVNPPSNGEIIDPKTLHLSAEFTESNLGTRVDPDGHVTIRLVAAQFGFVPACIIAPADTEVTIRASSPDVIHGLLVTGTNVNTMIVPGYVAQVHTVFRTTGDLLMPCHEFCGLGHAQMIGRVQVVPKDQFKPDANGKAHCAAR